jgi:L,D-peptidoglycan transpeptidase YkuD (ErfK/YbiS/YcfS/YnhG family)
MAAWPDPSGSGRIGSVLGAKLHSIWLVIIACACTQTGPTNSGASGASGGGSSSTGGAAGAASVGPIGAASLQLVTVVSADWTSVPAMLQRYERSSNAAWATVGASVPVVLGKSGLGWGDGLHPLANDGAPKKQEGDGRSPAGLFSLGSAFGYSPPSEATFLALPYLQATADLECVDDPSSSHYNQLVYRSTVANVDWSSSEKMSLAGDAYRWGLFVDHNVSPIVPGDGSCIFLHVWSGPSSSTVGCTASDESELKTVLGWLDPAKHPMLVQLPAAVYSARQAEWQLP